MMESSFSRRDALAGGLLALAGASLGAPTSSAAADASSTSPALEPPVTQPTAADQRPADEPFGYCLNTSTISGANLGIVQELEVAAKAGFHAVEPWLRDLDDYVKKGGKLTELRKRIGDLGLVIADAIGFAEWIVDDPGKRARGLESMKRDMETVAQIGCKFIAAPAFGAQDHDAPVLKLSDVAERYARLLELGRQTGVTPMVELWGFSRNLSRLGEVAYVSIESADRDACMLLDIYHLYKGGSEFTGLRQINGASLHLIHVNDYPATPARAEITDAFRVFPGDGVAPLDSIFHDLHASGFRGYLSLELFNRDYWKQSPAKVAAEGLTKTRAAVRKAFAKG